MTAGRFDEAARLYEELNRAIPGNPGLMMNLGLALHSSGDYQKAAAQFQSVVSRQPDFTPAWLMLGLARLKLGEKASALEPLQRVVQADPANRIALLELGDAYLSLNRAAEAIEPFRRLTEIDPANPKGWQGLGLSYAAQSNQVFARLEQTASESAYRDLLLARSRAAQQQPRSAFHLYRRALDKNTTVRGVHAALAEIYRLQNRSDWATVEEQRERALPSLDCRIEKYECAFRDGDFRQVLNLSEQVETPESWYWRARSYGELARGAFERLGQLPPSTEVYELMAAALRIQGLHRESAEKWREALKFAPQDARLKKELARSLWQAGELAAARPLLEELLKEQPDSAELNFELGDTLSQSQMIQEAVPYLEKSARLAPNLLSARAALGSAYFKLNRLTYAVPHLEAALSIDGDGQLHYMLARVYKMTGRDAIAKQMIKKSEEISVSAHIRRQNDAEITAPSQ